MEEASALLPRDQLRPSTSVQTLAFWLVIAIHLTVRALWVEAEVPPAKWSSVVSLGNKSSKMGLRRWERELPHLSLSTSRFGCLGVTLGSSLW